MNAFRLIKIIVFVIAILQTNFQAKGRKRLMFYMKTFSLFPLKLKTQNSEL